MANKYQIEMFNPHTVKDGDTDINFQDLKTMLVKVSFAIGNISDRLDAIEARLTAGGL